jgi:hypothetical protein
MRDSKNIRTRVQNTQRLKETDMNNHRKTHFTCLKCAGKQFSGVRLAKHHVKNYHKVKSREAINQFFLDWIITPIPILR